MQLGDNIKVHANQSSAAIDRKRHSDWDFPFGSGKRNADDKIGMNLSKTIWSLFPQITSTRQGILNTFNLVNRTLDLDYKGFPCNGAEKS